MIIAGNVGVNTTSSWVATLDGASIIIIAINRHVIRNVITSSVNITEIVSASVHIITSKSSMCALSSSNVTSISSASIQIIAVNWCLYTLSVENVTLVDLTGNWRTNNRNRIQAVRAVLWGVLASKSKVASC